MNNEKFSKNKVDTILEKKRVLDVTIQEYEKRIDEKLASLADNNIFSKEVDSNFFEANIHDPPLPRDDFLSGVDIFDDEALDKAVSNSDPFLNERDTPVFPTEKNDLKKTPPLWKENPKENLGADSKVLESFSDKTEKKSESQTPVLAGFHETKILPPLASLNETKFVTKPIEQTPKDSVSSSEKNPDLITIRTGPDLTKPPQKPRTSQKPSKESSESSFKKSLPILPEKLELGLREIVIPLVFFFLGIIALGCFLTFSVKDFTFVDYSFLFILFTCLIFTIAMPYNASLFVMGLILFSYIALSLITVFSIGLLFKPYQIGWIIVVPLLLGSSALLVKKIREIYKRKKELEKEIRFREEIDISPGLTIEKSYYKDLTLAMNRASKGETMLSLEMLGIPYLETLKAMSGSRLWDEILYQTLGIIKRQCFNTHLIYVLDGTIFSIIMENTSLKNTLMINTRIKEEFNKMIADYEIIDVPVEIDVASVSFSREIRNALDYRAIVMHLLKK